MQQVESVLGPIELKSLGTTLSHEHVIVSSGGIPQIYPEFIQREKSIEKGISRLSAAKKEGVDTIIDVTTLDLGRDINVLKQVSEGSEVNIICATGTWRDIPRAFWNSTPDAIAALYIREIEQGIENTNIKAGIIKVANDKGGVTREGELILRAAARAQKHTNTPISTHTWAPDRVGEQQVRIFEDENVDLNRVYIGHSNDTMDIHYLEGLMDKGVWLGLDRYPGGREFGTPDWIKRTEILFKLITDGYGKKLMLSHDWSVTLSNVPVEFINSRNKQNPDDYLFIHRNVLPMLKNLGASSEQVDDLMINNPRRFFEG
jgi:phosphotriesterase-related protein